MKKTVIIYGTSTGTCEDLAGRIGAKLGVNNIINVTDLDDSIIAENGCGDSESYPDTFVGGMAELYNVAKNVGACVIGSVSTNGYTFDESEAVVDGKFVGLALDEVNEDDKTDERINAWVAEIQPSL